MTTNPVRHSDYMPALAESTTGCLRWRWNYLDQLLHNQLAMLADDDWSNRQRASELTLQAAEAGGHG